ncbi:MAG: hypothetical protein IKO78_02145 [Bacilli bacterium]|nr:hypothetical protein [Bacilli bacterium]
MSTDRMGLANKILTSDDLFEIFSKMNETISRYKKISAIEESRNATLDYSYQEWSFKDNSSKLEFTVDFYDNTNVKYDKFDSFLTVYNTRLEEIKRIDVYFCLSYDVTQEHTKKFHYHSINLYITETDLSVSYNIDDSDNKVEEVYNLIKNKIVNAKEKYDYVVKNKTKIATIIALAIGLMPAIVITTLGIFVPQLKELYTRGYVLYPIACFVIAFVVGGTIESYMLDKYFKHIVPDKKYAYYDANKGKSVYKDDIEKFTSTSEILIGKNVNNVECRTKIKEAYDKYKGLVPIEVAIVLIMSLVIFLI